MPKKRSYKSARSYPEHLHQYLQSLYKNNVHRTYSRGHPGPLYSDGPQSFSGLPGTHPWRRAWRYAKRIGYGATALAGGVGATRLLYERAHGKRKPLTQDNAGYPMKRGLEQTYTEAEVAEFLRAAFGGRDEKDDESSHVSMSDDAYGDDYWDMSSWGSDTGWDSKSNDAMSIDSQSSNGSLIGPRNKGAFRERRHHNYGTWYYPGRMKDRNRSWYYPGKKNKSRSYRYY